MPEISWFERDLKIRFGAIAFSKEKKKKQPNVKQAET